MTACRELQMAEAAAAVLVFLTTADETTTEILCSAHTGLLRNPLMRVAKPGLPPAALTEERIGYFLQLVMRARGEGVVNLWPWIAFWWTTGAKVADVSTAVDIATLRLLTHAATVANVLRANGIAAWIP